MPFGEYIPFRQLARLITAEVDQQPRDFVAGQEVGVLPMGATQVGVVICFEVAFDNLVRDVVRGGGEIVAVQTNNATFGFAPMTEQQLAMSRFRAVEHGRTVLVSALAGVSAIVQPDGAVVDRAELDTAHHGDVHRRVAGVDPGCRDVDCDHCGRSAAPSPFADRRGSQSAVC
jgi:apolipoprotein N-acyltransferase